MPPVQHARAAARSRSWARRGLTGAALTGALAAAGVALTGQAAEAAPARPASGDHATAAPPGLGVRQPGVELAGILLDPTASTAPSDVRLSPNGVGLGDLVIGDPDATPPRARGLDLQLVNVRIND